MPQPTVAQIKRLLAAVICPWPKLAFAELIIVGGQSKYIISVRLSKVGQTMSLVSTLLPHCKRGKCKVK